MPGDRLSWVRAELSAGGAGAPSAKRLCEMTRDLADATGAGVMLMSVEMPQASLCSTDEVSALIEDLQYTLGEGPCVDAHHDGQVVLEPNLANPETPRWFAFTPPALEAGARALFAFPLKVGAIRLGALDLYRDRPGDLSDRQHADALALADLAASWVLDRQSEAPPGFVAEELEDGADFQLVVHNAAGMVSVQLGISITEALVRLRAYAFGHGRLLSDVAGDVVARRVRFE